MQSKYKKVVVNQYKSDWKKKILFASSFSEIDEVSIVDLRRIIRNSRRNYIMEYSEKKPQLRRNNMRGPLYIWVVTAIKFCVSTFLSRRMFEYRP